MQAAPYKGLHGGRASGKSHFFATAAIELCLMQRGTRIMCVREVQKSLQQSVKLLLEDKIREHGLSDAFDITKELIRTPGNGLIVFQGLQNHTADSIKSLENFHVAWVEEAQSLSEHSLTILRPTIHRNQGAELWASWNPRSPDDPIDKLLRKQPPDGAIVIQANYEDNPWLTEQVKKEIDYDRRRDPDKYRHVWLGEYQTLSEARVFRNWKEEEFETPEDARLYFGADWGFSVDPTVLVRCWIRDRTLFVDHEAWQVGCEIDRTPGLFDQVPGARKWPIVADSSNPQSISYMRRNGYRIQSSVKGPGSVEEGIEFLKSYDIRVHPRCKHCIDELSSYSYEIDKQTEQVLPKLKDAKNHVIDSIRYATEGVRRAPEAPSFSSY